MSSWHTYPKIYAIGHAALAPLFDGPVIVEEKIDGSQISFGRFNGNLKVRSRGKEQHEAPDKMFLPAIKVIETLPLRDGWTYSGEYLAKPKHNTLAYSRTPTNLIILFDIRIGDEQYLEYRPKAEEAARLGLEVVPLLYEGVVQDGSQLLQLLEHTSVLGGPNIEGVVVKNYLHFGRDGKALMGKYVSEAFKEKHQKQWKHANPSQKAVLMSLCEQYRAEPRWQKAFQHLRERDELTRSPKDIGPLIKEVQQDLRAEEEVAIKDALFKYAWKKIAAYSVSGLAEWYKKKLLEGAFEV